VGPNAIFPRAAQHAHLFVASYMEWPAPIHQDHRALVGRFETSATNVAANSQEFKRRFSSRVGQCIICLGSPDFRQLRVLAMLAQSHGNDGAVGVKIKSNLNIEFRKEFPVAFGKNIARALTASLRDQMLIDCGDSDHKVRS
jgi:hypothetical protein